MTGSEVGTGSPMASTTMVVMRWPCPIMGSGPVNSMPTRLNPRQLRHDQTPLRNQTPKAESPHHDSVMPAQRLPRLTKAGTRPGMKVNRAQAAHAC